MIVVSDTSPLLALAAIAQLDLLRRLFADVILPEAVAREIAHKHPAFLPLPRWLRSQRASDRCCRSFAVNAISVAAGRGHRRARQRLPATEFLRRFLQHVAPNGFMRIRHYGITANCRRTDKLARCRALLGQPPPPTAAADSSPTDGGDTAPPAESRRCPVCGGALRIIEPMGISVVRGSVQRGFSALRPRAILHARVTPLRPDGGKTLLR